ncbi:MAG: DUF2116 family Zn-ribbon domain-containing protein [Ruminococcus sp.]|nr:DUF2116 family Zn-ribbon domain-containing protein [Ruminococcus sp.]
MKQCDFCGKEITYHEQYCSDDCQLHANRFYERTEKFAKLFTGVNVVCIFGIPVGLFLMSVVRPVGTALAAGSCILLGLILLIFPFPTEGMIKKFKISKSIRITRFIGLGVIALGLLVAGLTTFVL